MAHRLPVEIVPIEDEGYHIITSGNINGMPARLLVDTGASRTVFDSQRIGLFPGLNSGQLEAMDKKSTGLGTNSMTSHYLIIGKLDLGGVVLENYKAVVINMIHINESYAMLGLPEIDGVLGGDILVDYKAVIDYAERCLVFYGS